ncbi:MAG: hypothetical protein JSW61_05560 [Candidatus Thorarchaeota archaeon]|nr:MAG: hypothetical protein JSW61_05560 [Candidatus Thorarchaeota archaeon]
MTVIIAYDPILYGVAVAVYVLSRLLVIDDRRRIIFCIVAFVFWFLAGGIILFPVVTIPYNPWIPTLMIPVGLIMLADILYQLRTRRLQAQLSS